MNTPRRRCVVCICVRFLSQTVVFGRMVALLSKGNFGASVGAGCPLISQIETQIADLRKFLLESTGWRRHARLHELQAPKLGEEACMLIRVSHHTPRLKPSCPAAEILPRTRPQLQGPPWTRQGSRRGWRGTSERRVREHMMPDFRTTAMRCAPHPSRSRSPTPCPRARAPSLRRMLARRRSSRARSAAKTRS